MAGWDEAYDEVVPQAPESGWGEAYDATTTDEGVDFGNPMYGRTIIGAVSNISADAMRFLARTGLPTGSAAQGFDKLSAAVEPEPEQGIAADVVRGAASLPVAPLAFLSEGEQAAQSAQDHGASPGEALAVGTGVGILSGGLELAMPLAAGKALKNGVKLGVKSLLKETVKDAAIEGGTEGLQTVLQNAVPAAYEGDISGLTDNVGRSVGIGALVGGGTGAATTAVGGMRPVAPTPEAEQAALAALPETDAPVAGESPADATTAPPGATPEMGALPEELTATQMLEPEVTEDEIVTESLLVDADEEAAALEDDPGSAFEESFAEDEGELGAADFDVTEGLVEDLGPRTLPTPPGGGNTRIKQIIHKLTGLYKVKDLDEVDTAVELRRSLREQAKAAAGGEQVGIQKGKRFGKWNTEDAKLKGKERLAAERAKNRDQRLAAMAKAEYRKLVGKIRKEGNSSMSPDYRRKLEEFQNQFDFDLTSKRSIDNAAARAQAVEGGRATPDPRAGRRPIGDVSLQELRDFAEQVAILRKQGRLKQKLQKKKVARAIERDGAQLASTLAGQDRITLFKRGGLLDRGFQHIMRPARMFQALDKMSNAGPWTRLVWRPMSDAHLRATARNAETSAKLLGGMDNLAQAAGLNGHGEFITEVLDKERSVGDGPFFSGSERIGIAMLSKNDMGKLTSGRLRRGDGSLMPAITEQQVVDIINSLTPSEKGFMDMAAQRFAEQGPEVQRVYEALTGERLDLQDNYFPNIGSSETLDAATAADPFSLMQAFKGQPPVHRTEGIASTKAKVEDGAQSVNVDALDVLRRNTAAVDFYLEVAPEAVRSRRLFADSKVAKGVQALSNGSKMREMHLEGWLNRWVEDSGRSNVPQVDSAGEGWATKLRHNAVPAYLAYRAGVMLKQPMSIVNAAAEAGYSAPILSANKDVMAAQAASGSVHLNDNPIYQEMAALFPEVKYRKIEQNLSEMEQRIAKRANRKSGSLKERIGAKKDKITNTGLGGIRNMDKFAVTVVAKGVYSQELAANRAAGINPMAAKRAAIERTKQVLERTQGDARTTALPQFFREPGEMNRMFTMFTNEVNQNTNLHAAVLKQLMEGKQDVFSKNTAHWAAMGLMTAAINALINHAGDPVAALGDLPDEALGQFVGGVPGAGAIAQGAARKVVTGNPLSLGFAGDFAPVGSEGVERAIRGVNKATSGDPIAGSFDMLIALAGMYGLPAEATKTLVKGVGEWADPKKPFDVRAPFFSPYQRRSAGAKR